MPTTADRQNPIEAILEWLHRGYPEGIPQSDYHPVLALLRKSLTTEQLDDVVDYLHDNVSGGSPTVDEVKAAIDEVTNVIPDARDVNRVAARLAAVGWPLATQQH